MQRLLITTNCLPLYIIIIIIIIIIYKTTSF
jgi:hypothetical protein